MTAHRDLASLIGPERIAAVVADFCERVRRDPVLAATFAHGQDWQAVKTRLAHFWAASATGTMSATPAVRTVTSVHAPIRSGPWLRLFEATVREHLPADLADAWLMRVRSMADWVRVEMQKSEPAGSAADSAGSHLQR